MKISNKHAFIHNVFFVESNFVLPKIKIYYMYLRVDVYVASKQLFISFIQKGLVDLSGFVRNIAML